MHVSTCGDSGANVVFVDWDYIEFFDNTDNSVIPTLLAAF